MTTAHDPSTLPAGIPAPVDDGAADHLTGSRVPSVKLPATSGPDVDLSALPGLVAVFVFPRTGRPGEAPLVPDWDAIPGARGCTVQTCAFRDLARDFGALDCRVLGLSAQDTDYQQEMAGRLQLPFPVLSDADLRLADAMRLPQDGGGGADAAEAPGLDRPGRADHRPFLSGVPAGCACPGDAGLAAVSAQHGLTQATGPGQLLERMRA